MPSLKWRFNHHLFYHTNSTSLRRTSPSKETNKQEEQWQYISICSRFMDYRTLGRLGKYTVYYHNRLLYPVARARMHRLGQIQDLGDLHGPLPGDEEHCLLPDLAVCANYIFPGYTKYQALFRGYIISTVRGYTKKGYEIPMDPPLQLEWNSNKWFTTAMYNLQI